jgi:DNA-binding CsgD family transcriptional regulator
LIPARLAKAATPFKLTPRQLQTLLGVASGEPRKATADALKISPRTIRQHAENARRKIGNAPTLAAAIARLAGF